MKIWTSFPKNAKNILAILILVNLILGCDIGDIKKINNVNFEKIRKSSDQFDRITKDMKEFEISGSDSDKIYELNYNPGHYRIDTTTLQVKITGPNERREIVVENEFGKLYGINNGEFGGSLSFVRKNGLSTKLLDENVAAIFKYHQKLVVLTGLSHLGMWSGMAYFYKYNNDNYKVEREFELNGAPSGFTIFEDTIYIATSNGVDKLTENYSENLFKVKDLSILYPQNVFANNTHVIVGARGCIIGYNKFTKKTKFYEIKNDSI